MRFLKKTLFLSLALALLSSLTVMADTWTEENGKWYCYDNSGNRVMGKWRTNGGIQYYLDDTTGAMVTDSTVDYGDDTYYCDENGARVTNRWIKVSVENGTDGFEYMYFGSTGKAYKCASPADSDKTIDGKKYRFSSEGYMLYGFLDEDDERVIYPSEADRYYGTRDNGAAVTDWVNIKNGGDTGCNGLYMSKSSVWFYFENGRKVKNVTEKNIGGNRYGFDQNGAMLTGWHLVSGDGDYISRLRYYGGTDDGIIKKNCWIHSVDHDADIPDEFDYYLGSTGAPVHSVNQRCIYRIDGGYYCFDTNGRLVTGFVKGTIGDSDDLTSFVMNNEDYISYDSLADLVLDQTNPSAIETVLYFAEDEISKFEEDEEIEISDEDASGSPEADGNLAEGGKKTVIKKKGELCTGIISDDLFSGKLYLNRKGLVYNGFKKERIYNAGVMLVSDNGPVSLVKLNKASDRVNNLSYYMVNQAGKVLKDTLTRDDEKYYWYADRNYVSYKFKGAVLGDRSFESQAAHAFKSGKKEFAVTGANYRFIETPKLDEDMLFMYYEVTWDYYVPDLNS